jgi:hypothetical protein
MQQVPLRPKAEASVAAAANRSRWYFFAYFGFGRGGPAGAS